MKIKTLSLRKLTLASAVALTAGWGAMAQAQESTTFEASAEVIGNCVVAADALDFDNYDPVSVNSATGVDLDQTSDIRVTCTNGMPSVKIGLVYNGMMDGPGLEGEHLIYTLSSDSAGGNTWDDVELNKVSVIADGTEKTHPVHGRAPKGQNLAHLGNHTETVTVNVTW
ncbi:Csu type fimbrial protein [Halomonas sp. MA07-2]|uniref:Csu type fimbrial protein n=1 Tax=Halomonas sp. MA07-2 TaxID=3440841 RepID=UPI003EEF14A6